ncbi:MAG: DUF177 domain-containing protein [Actinomycetota bacterium]
MPESRLVVDVVELQRRTGTRREVRAELALPDLAVGERSIVEGRLDVDLIVEAVTEGIVASGTVSGVSRAPCRRCLDDVDEPFEADIREVFERNPTEGETWPIEDERIDLTPVVREWALLSLPLAPLCGEDCAGPEPDRFPAQAYVEPDPEAEPPRDERWAALDALSFDE